MVNNEPHSERHDTVGDFIIVEGFLGKSDGLRSNSAVFDENEVRALGWRQKGVIRTDG